MSGNGAYRPGSVEPLWDRVDRNRRKLAFFVTLFVAAWALAAEVVVVLPIAIALKLVGGADQRPFSLLRPWGWGFSQLMATGAAVGLVTGLIWVVLALKRPEARLVKLLRAERVPMGELAETKSVLHDMSVAVGLLYPPPLYVLDTIAVNAFILGRRPESLSVGITRGMLRLLSVEEQRAVFANLLARYRDGDTLVATAASALMAPVWAMRDRDMKAAGDDWAFEDGTWKSNSAAASATDALLLVLPFYAIAVAVTELLYFGQMEQHILNAEAADAKGMLLLKDPRSMLTALERALPEDNAIPQGGAALAPLFFCWTGDAYISEEDSEFRRVGRMREALGVEGIAEIADADIAEYLPPPVPSLDGGTPLARSEWLQDPPARPSEGSKES